MEGLYSLVGTAKIILCLPIVPASVMVLLYGRCIYSFINSAVVQQAWQERGTIPLGYHVHSGSQGRYQGGP
jgi:hypothetical protein